MTDETVGQPAAETPADPTTKVDDLVAAAVEVATEETPQEASEPVEDEFEEVEWEDGKKYKVPKPLKDGVLRHKDYTQKTMQVAEQRRQVEAAAAAEYQRLQAASQYLSQRDQIGRQHVQEIGALIQADQQLSQYAKVDWAKLEQDDPFKAMSLQRQYTQLRDYRNGLYQNVQSREQQIAAENRAREQQRAADGQRNFATAYQRTNEQLAKEIPNWNQELASNLASFARENGIDEASLRQVAINPNAVKLLHKAYTGHQLAEAQQKAAKAAEPRVEPAPLKKVSGSGAKTGVDLAKADMETYVRERQKQIAARAAR